MKHRIRAVTELGTLVCVGQATAWNGWAVAAAFFLMWWGNTNANGRFR